eukprot:gene19515-23334_t
MSPVVNNCLEETLAGPGGGKFQELKTHKTIMADLGSFSCLFSDGTLVPARLRLNARTLLQRLGMLIVTCPVPEILQASFRAVRRLPFALQHEPGGGNATLASYPLTACLSHGQHVYSEDGDLPGDMHRIPTPQEPMKQEVFNIVLTTEDDVKALSTGADREDVEDWNQKRLVRKGSLAAEPKQVRSTKLAMCTMLSPRLVDGSWADELVKQWIEYHKLVEVGHFLIYVDAHPGVNVTHFWDALQPYVDAGEVTLIDWTLKYMLDLREPVSVNEYHFMNWMYPGMDFPNFLQHITMWPQTMANHDCLLRTRHLAKWVALSDVDELFVPKT